MGDMVAVEDAGYWLIEHLAHIVVMDEYGNHCTLDDETELEIELATNDTDLESAEGTPDFSRLPAPDPEGENGSEPDDETQLPRDLATPLVVPAKLRSRNNWHCLSATLSTTTLILPYQWNAYTNYHSSLGVPTTVQIIMSAPPSASSVIISAISATLTTQSGSLQLSPASPSILLQANQGIAKKNTIDAKLARTTANVGIYEDLGSWVRYGPAAVGQPHIHGGIVYGYSPLFAWTVPSELPHWGTPGTAHNTYRGNSRIGVVDFGNEIDHLIYSGAKERVARAIRAEVTYDSTKLGQQGLQVTWDVSLEYHTYAYGYHSAVESGYSHSGGAVEMFVSANLAGKRIEASAGVDQNLSVQASSITVGVGPLSIPIPIPSTSGKSLDGSKATQQAPLIYSTTGQTTLFTVGAIAGQVHRAKSGGGYFQYETDHGLASHLINSRVEVTIQIGGNPSFVLGEVKFAP